MKTFLQKNLGNLITFVNTIVINFRQNSQYQQEKSRDLASQLEFLPSILLKFYFQEDVSQSQLINFFFEKLKPFIKAELKQRGRELSICKDIIKQLIEAELKAKL